MLCILICNSGCSKHNNVSIKSIRIGVVKNSTTNISIANSLCKLFRKENQNHDCRIVKYSSSEALASNVENQTVDFGIIRGNVENNYRGLASVFVLYNSALTVLSKDSGVRYISSFPQKHILVLSGARGAFIDAIKKENQFLKKEMSDFQFTTVENEKTFYKELLKNKYMAGVLLKHHPDIGIQNMINEGFYVLNVDNPKINELIKDKKYYWEEYIPKGLYGNKRSINTIGISESLVTSVRQDKQKVKKMFLAVTKNFPMFKLSHNALLEFTPKDMISKIVSPFHGEIDALLKTNR